MTTGTASLRPGLLLAGLALFAAVAGRTALSRAQAPDPEQQARAAYARLPLRFEKNQGQTDAQVQFLSRGSGYTLWLTCTEAVLGLRKEWGSGRKGEWEIQVHVSWLSHSSALPFPHSLPL